MGCCLQLIQQDSNKSFFRHQQKKTKEEIRQRALRMIVIKKKNSNSNTTLSLKSRSICDNTFHLVYCIGIHEYIQNNCPNIAQKTIPIIMLSKDKEVKHVRKGKNPSKFYIQLYNCYNSYELEDLHKFATQAGRFSRIPPQPRNRYFSFQAFLRQFGMIGWEAPLLKYQSADPLQEYKQYKSAHFQIFLL